MSPCKKYQPLLVGKLFAELDSHAENQLDLHLDGCAHCRQLLVEFRELVQSAGKPVRPQLPDHFWEGYWDRLAARMEEETSLSVSVRSRLGHWLATVRVPIPKVAWGLVLLVIGFVVGHYVWQSEQSPPLADEPSIRRPISSQEIATRKAQFFERSKILLLGIVNEDFSEASPADFDRQRQAALELKSEAREIRAAMAASPDLRLLQLIDQLELIYLQIANLEIEHDLTGVELVREGIDREGLLLKINLEEMTRQARGTSPAGKNRLRL